MNRGQILIVPAIEKGKGGGHLCRCITLTCDLRTLGREALLFLPENSGNISSFLQSVNFNPAWRITDDKLKGSCKNIECVILDRFQTPAPDFLRWKEIAPVIGIDEGGVMRESFDFLIDILVPKKFIFPPANITEPSLLNFPAKPLPPKKRGDGVLKVLITFGQEDTAGLGYKTASALSKKNKDGMDITLLRGGLTNKNETYTLPNVHITQAVANLAEHLAEYGLIITHYGITAYEALYAGTKVLLVSPTVYHAKLARAAGFYELGIKKIPLLTPNSPFLKKLEKQCNALAVKYKLNQKDNFSNLAALCGSLSPQVNRRCPVCGANARLRSVSRFSERTYRRCSRCGVIYMDRTCPPPIEYERKYFFDFYKKQYGRTYLEDFPNIKAAGKRRLKIIKSLLNDVSHSQKLNHVQSAELTLLDIGCAYGPFLEAAHEEGFSPSGIDPAKDAICYVQQTLGIPAVQGFFPNSPLPTPYSPLPTPHSPLYDVVTLWFVIEHFTDCVSVLAAIRNILKPYGILAFSTPSYSGISGSNLNNFLLTSPADHWTVWSPKMCKKAITLAGFKVKKIVICGCHPERFPLLGKFAKSKKSPLYWLLLAVSKFFSLGDTFEVYAVRN